MVYIRLGNNLSERSERTLYSCQLRFHNYMFAKFAFHVYHFLIYPGNSIENKYTRELYCSWHLHKK